MEIQEYALQHLNAHLNQVIARLIGHIATNLAGFRKHTIEKTHEELSLYASHIKTSEQERSIEEALSVIREETQNWPLPIREVLVKGNVLSLKLSRTVAFQTVLKEILGSNGTYGENNSALKSKALVVGLEVIPPDALTSLRIQLLVDAAKNILGANGYHIVDGPSDTVDLEIHYSTRHADPSVAWAQCNRVFTSHGDQCQLDVGEFYKLREDDMRTLSEHKYWDEDKGPTIAALAQAAVTVDLVQVKASYPLRIKMERSVAYGIRESTSKGAPFIMYNYARLRAIQSKYEQAVAKGIYPPLPELDGIDTSLLNQEEEWLLVFDHLLEYPVILRNIAKNAASGEIQQHTLCSFILRMCHSISVYYRRVRILQEPKPHLMPTLHARLMLIKAAEETLKHACKLLNIVPVECM